MISTELLLRYGALSSRYERNTFIFEQGSKPLYYHQVVAGSVKMFTLSEEGKEYIHQFFADGASFGEPPLFFDGPYPASAMAMTESTVIRLKKEKFELLLLEHPKAMFEVLKVLSGRLREKSARASELALFDPEQRVVSLLQNVKSECKPDVLSDRIFIPFTRQQIADMTGLRVETVIRVIKNLEEKGFLEIRDRKVFV